MLRYRFLKEDRDQRNKSDREVTLLLAIRAYYRRRTKISDQGYKVRKKKYEISTFADGTRGAGTASKNKTPDTFGNYFSDFINGGYTSLDSI